MLPLLVQFTDGLGTGGMVATLHTAHKSTPLQIEAMENLQNFSIAISEATNDNAKDSSMSECKLLIHAKIYQAADKWGLEHLKEVPSARFLQCLRDTSVDPTTLEEALDKVYEGTSPEDTDLRLTLTKLCVKNAAAFIKHAEVVAVIERHELLSWRIGTSLHIGQASELAKKTHKIVDTLLRLNCDCPGKPYLQGSKLLRPPLGHPGWLHLAIEPRRIEDWEGVMLVGCSMCDTVTFVSAEDTI